RQPGDRTLSRAQAVRAGPGALRRAVRAARHGARHREPRGRAGGAGAGVRGDGWARGAVWRGGGDRGSDQTRNAECGTEMESSLDCSAFPLPRSAFRVGWGRGKFVSWVAATRAKPGEAVIVPVGGEAKFLASQRLAVLPLDPDTHRRLLQLGVKTLGALVALPEEAVVSQFGRAGRRLWRLAAGLVAEPVVGRVVPEPIVAALTFFTPVGERDLLAHALDKLVDRALGDPRRSGWRVQVVRVRAELEHGASWLVTATLKDPSATREHIAAPLKTQLERSPPVGAVERLVV